MKAEKIETGLQGATFEQVVGLWQDMVYNTALGIVQQAEDAEDITQEVFVQLYQSLDSLRGEAQLSTWLYRVAINKSLDFEKRKSRKKRGGLMRLIFHLPEADEPVHFDHPGVLAENKENARCLFMALSKIPPMQRVVFLLYKMEGMSPAEIARINQLSLSAVESLLARARKNLRKYLKTWFEQNQNG